MLRRGVCLWGPLAAALVSLWLAQWLSGFGWTLQGLCAVLLGRLAALFSFRLDRLGWGEWGFEEALSWTLGAGVGGAIAAVVGAAAAGAAGGSFFASLFAAETLVYWSGGMLLEGALRLRRPAAAQSKPLERPRRLLIYGSGAEARELAARLRRAPERWEPCGYLDEDLNRLQAMLDGLPVLGNLDSLPRLAQLHDVSDLFVAGPANDEAVDEIAGYANVRVRRGAGPVSP